MQSATADPSASLAILRSRPNAENIFSVAANRNAGSDTNIATGEVSDEPDTPARGAAIDSPDNVVLQPAFVPAGFYDLDLATRIRLATQIATANERDGNLESAFAYAELAVSLAKDSRQPELTRRRDDLKAAVLVARRNSLRRPIYAPPWTNPFRFVRISRPPPFTRRKANESPRRTRSPVPNCRYRHRDQIRAAQQPAAAASLTAYVPQDALLTIESPDFAALLHQWTNSAESKSWLASDNYSVFQNSRLFGRLSDAQDSFAKAAGIPAGVDLLNQVAGKQSVFAWYDIGKLEFLYITRMPAEQADRTQLFQARGTPSNAATPATLISTSAPPGPTTAP